VIVCKLIQSRIQPSMIHLYLKNKNNQDYLVAYGRWTVFKHGRLIDDEDDDGYMLFKSTKQSTEPIKLIHVVNYISQRNIVQTNTSII